MTHSRAAAGGVLFLLLLAAFATRAWSRPGAVDTAAVAPASLLDAIVGQLAAETERLQRGLSRVPAIPSADVRDIFSGRELPAAGFEAPAVEQPPLVPPFAPIAVEPTLTLVGIAEDNEGGTLERTAVISDGTDELFLVKERDTIGARYRVAAVGSDRAEIVDVASSRTFVLMLK